MRSKYPVEFLEDAEQFKMEKKARANREGVMCGNPLAVVIGGSGRSSSK